MNTYFFDVKDLLGDTGTSFPALARDIGAGEWSYGAARDALDG